MEDDTARSSERLEAPKNFLVLTPLTLTACKLSELAQERAKHTSVQIAQVDSIAQKYTYLPISTVRDLLLSCSSFEIAGSIALIRDSQSRY